MPKKYEKLTISFTDADEDIIELVRELKKSNKASEFIREAIREKMNKEESNSNLESKVEELIKKVQRIEIYQDRAITNVSPGELVEKKEPIKEENQDDTEEEEKQEDSLIKGIESNSAIMNALSSFDF